MDIENIPKIGSKTGKLLNKLNIYTNLDLLRYYPYKYNFIKYISIKDAGDDLTYYIKVKVVSVPKVIYIKNKLNKMEFLGENDGNIFKIVIFNRAFYKKNLMLNREIIVVGKYNKLKNVFNASDIKFKVEDEKIEPIYHLTENLKNSVVINAISECLSMDYNLCDYVPDYLNEKYNFLSKNEAIKKIHCPSNIDDIKKSKLKLIYEELFLYMFKISYLKNVNSRAKGLVKNFNGDDVDEFLNSLNFCLTVDQEKAIKEILDDMKNNKRMNRLVLGDVGSGKTIVAIVAILANYLSGYQSTFMVPTEVLAKQHYESIKDYFKFFDISICLIIGSMSKKERENYYKLIKNGDIDVVIGTHSLINESLIFKNLGLVITDEQHRFGVNQRNLLQNKGVNGEADVLYLSATPIPRTYALTIYGDLDLSLIKTKPNMRKEVITKVILEKNIKEVLRAMLEELKLNHQIFIVSPLIENNDELNLSSVEELKNKMNIAFNNKVRIEILHGKLKQKEKDLLMEEFRNNKINILISTTVIEVGIDIPNASMMIIFNAERFGLATLHQLRGRVGRSNIQSYCYLITNNSDNKRLRVMEESSDGFYISQKDFEQRGQGDLFGIKQSGDMNFKIANFQRDYTILVRALEDAKYFVCNKLYLNDDKYVNIVKEIDFLD